MRKFLENGDEFEELKVLTDSLHFTSTIYPRNTLSWIGGSIVGQLSALDRFALSREDYLKNGNRDRFGEDYMGLPGPTDRYKKMTGKLINLLL